MTDEEMVAAAVKTRYALIIIGIIALVIGSALAWMITRAITGPVRKAVGLADEIAAGDLSQRLNLNQSDEIGQLGMSLDRMADNLAKHAEVAETIAAGDLTRDVQTASDKDQLGNALKTMLDSLRDMVGSIQVAGEQIASGSGQGSQTPARRCPRARPSRPVHWKR